MTFVGTDRESRRASVPFDSLQQLTRNALMHRSYEFTNAPVHVLWFNDRVEIHSPGGRFGKITVENFATPGLVDYRNPTIAGVLGQLGYVHRFGVGLEIARATLIENGSPPLEIAPTSDWIEVIVRLAT